MKHLFLIALIVLAAYDRVSGQCVIYACENTGAFGAGFNNDNTPTTFMECKELAIKTCKEKGGNNCVLLFQGSKASWWALITGKKTDGRNYFLGGDGYSSKEEAERAVRKQYREGGGVNAENIAVYSWYAYSNVKN